MRLPSSSRLTLAASVIMTMAGLAMIMILNVVAPRLMPADAAERVAMLQKAGLPEQAEPVLVSLLDSAPLDMDLNYRYLSNHFALVSTKRTPRKDVLIEQRYAQLATMADAQDIWLFGLGFIRLSQDRYSDALAYFARVAQRDLRYLNGSTGRAYLKLGEQEQAATFLKRELDMSGDVEGAVHDLQAIYYRQKNVEGMRALLSDRQAAPYIDSIISRRVALADRDLLGYLRLVFINPWQHIELGAALSALIICLMWFIYLWRIDVLEQDSVRTMLICLGLGGLSALFTFPLNDAIAIVHPMTLNGTRVNDFLYSLINIGLVEELAKLVPVLLIAWLTQQLDEPIDFMVYAGLSGLGFATLENSLYFTGHGLGIVVNRFLVSTVLHMAMTGIACYALAYARHLRRPRPGRTGPFILAGLAVAVVVHALFDYFIFMRLEGLSYLSILIALLLADTYGILIRASLDVSPFARRSTELQDRLTNYALLYITTVTLLLIMYVYNHVHFTTDIANAKEIVQGQVTFFLVIVIFAALGEISVRMRPAWPKTEGGFWEDY
jgi:RsiW-degrading membrane proteinase PrsW (M82 family)